MLLVVFALSSCGLGKGDGGDETEAPETAEETVDVEAMNKELSEYTNVVVSDEDVLSVMKMMNARRSKLEDWPTYYEIVKMLGSTGKNTSKRMYRYEWEMEGGKYFEVIFLGEYTTPTVPSDAQGGGERVCIFSKDFEKIRENYRTDAEYLYEIFYHTRFEDYPSFLSWFGCHNLPDDDGVVYEIPDGENYYMYLSREAWEKFENVPVKKEKALALKSGMTLYEAICRLESRGDSSGSGNHHYWKTEDGFYVEVGVVRDPFIIQSTISSVKFYDEEYGMNDDFMYDYDFYIKAKEAP